MNRTNLLYFFDAWGKLVALIIMFTVFVVIANLISIGAMRWSYIMLLVSFGILSLSLVVSSRTNWSIIERFFVGLGVSAFIVKILYALVFIFVAVKWGSAGIVFESRLSRMNQELQGLHEILSPNQVSLSASRIEITSHDRTEVKINVSQSIFSRVSDASVAKELFDGLEAYLASDEFVNWIQNHVQVDQYFDQGLLVSVTFRHPLYFNGKTIASTRFLIDLQDGEALVSRT